MSCSKRLPILAICSLLMALAFPSLVRATGTTFTESFNSGNLCWNGGPSSCNQLWVVPSGSGQSIVATPGVPPANTVGAYSLQKVETPGTTSYLYTTGTFPRIPAGTAYDLYFPLYVSSQAMKPYYSTRLITLASYYNGGSYAAQISFTYDGKNFSLYAGGASASPRVNISVNAWHTVQLHVAGGSSASYLAVDGGAQNAFTENAQDFAYLVVGSSSGNQNTLTYYLGNININSALGGGPPPSMYIDFEAASDGTTITPAIMAASTHCGNGLWTVSPNPIPGMTISSNGQKTLHSPVTTCGTQYTDASGTRGLQYDMSQTSRIAIYKWSTTSSNASAGFFYKISLQDTNWYSVFAITAGGGDYTMLHMHSGNMYLETKGGITTPIPFSPNTWYWITMQYNAGGTHYLNVYETTNWTLVGSASNPATGNYKPDGLEIGRTGSESGWPNGYWYYDNVVVDYVTGKFPILP